MHGLEIEYWDDVDFIYLDIDDPATNQYKGELGFLFQPHLVFIDGNGQVVEQLIGFADEAGMRAILDGMVQNAN